MTTRGRLRDRRAFSSYPKRCSSFQRRLSLWETYRADAAFNMPIHAPFGPCIFLPSAMSRSLDGPVSTTT